MADKIRLTHQNLLRYGNIVLTREWTSQQGSVITERYVIWETSKMNGDEIINPNKDKMFLSTMVNGEYITMKQVQEANTVKNLQKNIVWSIDKEGVIRQGPALNSRFDIIKRMKSFYVRRSERGAVSYIWWTDTLDKAIEYVMHKVEPDKQVTF